MNHGQSRDDWQVADAFGSAWRIFVVPSTERRGGSDWQAQWQIEQLVFDGFSHSGARDDRVAATLLEVYDALTNSGLSRRHHRPTVDPSGILRGIDREIRQTLVAALRAGEIRVERVTPVPWPFVEVADADVVDDVAPVGETTTWIGLCLVDQTGKAVGRKRYRVTLPDGSVKEGVLGSDGTARIDGIGTPGNCQIDFLDFDKVDWGPQTLLPGGTVPGETGPVGADTTADSAPASTLAPDQLQISLVDDTGVPVAGASYSVVAPDGQTYTGQLDNNGAAQLSGLPAGDCTVSFPDIDAANFASSTS